MTTDAQVFLPPLEILRKVRSAVNAAVERNAAEAILLSGGLDTSIVASLAATRWPIRAYTVALAGVPAPDIEYAHLMARHLDLKLNLHVFGMDELMESLPEVVRTLRVFDPMEIRNSAAVYIGMKEAKKDGVSTIFTGDACDELFAGYSFLFSLGPSELKSYLQRLWTVMNFSAIPMAESLGMVAKIPFLDPEVRKLASEVDPSLLVVEQDNQKWGKWIVRKAFEDLLPRDVTWRVKTPIEFGCGTTLLPQTFNQTISDQDFREKQRTIREIDGVAIRDKEHLAYYETFHEVFGVRPETSGRVCPGCHYEVREDATFCRTCGAYPI